MSIIVNHVDYIYNPNTVNEKKALDDVSIKVNLYDSTGEIYFTEDRCLFADDFDGYDTISLNLYDNGNTLLKAKSARLFVTKN